MYDERRMLKLYRKLGVGTNPELEIGRYLTERGGFGSAPALSGALEYERNRGEPMTLAVTPGVRAEPGGRLDASLDALS